MISELKIEGFKSFGPLTPPIQLGPVNFVVGANAAGKTNLISALRFLKTAITQNVDLAVAEFGGLAEVRNKISRERVREKGLKLGIQVLNPGWSVADHRGKSNVEHLSYDVQIDLRSDQRPIVLSEKLSVNLLRGDGQDGTVVIARTRNEVLLSDSFSGKDEETSISPADGSLLVAGSGFFSFHSSLFRNYVEGWTFFNVNPDVARLPAKEGFNTTLGLSGESLSVVLKQIKKENPEAFQAIINGLKGVVPGFQSIDVKRIEVEGTWAFQILEEKIKGRINPRSTSDGTIRLLALMVIAYWAAKDSSLVCIEEPENGIHPHLSENIVELVRAQTKKQFLITTHNPNFLDFLKPEEVILCDKIDGFTKVRHASAVEDIEKFRKRFRLGELWEQGALGGIP